MPPGQHNLLRANGDLTPWKFALVPKSDDVHILITKDWKFSGQDVEGHAVDQGWGDFGGGGTTLSLSWNSALLTGSFTVTVSFKRWCGEGGIGGGPPTDTPEETLEWGGSVWGVVIRYKDIDITEPQANPQSVMVGEQVALTASITPDVPPDQIGDKQWNLGSDDVVKGYDLNAALPEHPADPPTQKTPIVAADLTGDQVSYYYINGAFTGQSVTVSFSAKVNDDTVTATAKFKVFRPQIATVMVNGAPVSTFEAAYAAKTPPVELLFIANGQAILTLGEWPAMKGITWTASAMTPPDMGAGEIAYIQLVNTKHVRDDVDAHQTQINSNNKFILDDGTGDALYGAAAGRTTAIQNGATVARSLDDTPQQPVRPVDWKMLVEDDFTLYFMYKPNGTDSIWTTVGLLNWNWKGRSTRVGPNFFQDWQTGGIPAQGGGKIIGAESHDLPTWSDTITALIALDWQPVP
jgi:hypothetical protein